MTPERQAAIRQRALHANTLIETSAIVDEDVPEMLAALAERDATIARVRLAAAPPKGAPLSAANRGWDAAMRRVRTALDAEPSVKPQ